MASEQHGSEGLAAELVQAEGEVGKLRSETAGMKQDLQDALELCDQHEALLEERNHELTSCDAEIRYQPPSRRAGRQGAKLVH